MPIETGLTIREVFEPVDGEKRHNGNEIQGANPVHGSPKTGTNTKINTQEDVWRCFACGSGGGILEAIAVQEGIIDCSDAESGVMSDASILQETLTAAKEKYGADIDEDNQKSKAEIKKQEKVNEILEKTAELAHGQLSEEDRKRIKKERNLDDKDIDKYRIGKFTPELDETLRERYKEELLVASGLYWESDDGDIGPMFTEWLPEKKKEVGRIIIPYTHYGKVKYFIGRRTPEMWEYWENQSEKKENLEPIARILHYSESDTENLEEARQNWIKRQCFKYKKLIDTDYNDHILWTDIDDREELIITEGIYDAISVAKAGYSVLSPITPGFRNDDIPKIVDKAKQFDKVYIAFDGDDAGETGQRKAAEELTKEGVEPCLVELPEDIDFDDWTNENSYNLSPVLEEAEFFIDKVMEEINQAGRREKGELKRNLWSLIRNWETEDRNAVFELFSNTQKAEKEFKDWKEKEDKDRAKEGKIDEKTDLKAVRYELAEKLVEDRDIISVKKGVNNQGHEFYYYDKSDKAWKGDGEQQIRKCLRNAMEEQYSVHHRTEVQDQIKAVKQKHLNDMGLKEGEIPVQNGILQLNGEKELRNIEKQDYVLWKLPVEYNETAEAEKLKELLDDWDVTGEVRDKVQEFIGYTLMHWTASKEKALMILGPTDSGKSVFLDIIRNMFGAENCANESLQDITNTRWSTANLEGHPVNIDHDLDTDAINDIGKAKKVISGNPITVEQKGVQPYKLEPTTKHLFSANKAPERTDEEEAFYNRWLTVVFPNQVDEEEQIDKEQLLEEINFSGVLNWAIEGLERLKEQEEFTGDVDPLETQELWKEYGDHFDRFISNYCQKKKNHNPEAEDAKPTEEITWKIKLDTIFQVYKEYAEGRVGNVLSKTKFGKRMKKENSVIKTKVRVPGEEYSVRGFKGITLAENAYRKASSQ
ncbi:MAG: phage/plasmid primase, P4 family [Candidatus Nanohaloarchaea archaeon]